MGVVVSFNYQQFVLRYPEFAAIDPSLIQEYWNEATLYHRNDGGGPVAVAGQQSALLNMLTAHICQLNAPLNGLPSPSTVGRITNASEGSVSVATELHLPDSNAMAQFCAQSKYGLAYWSATSCFRTMRYRFPYPRVLTPWPFG